VRRTDSVIRLHFDSMTTRIVVTWILLFLIFSLLTVIFIVSEARKSEHDYFRLHLRYDAALAEAALESAISAGNPDLLQTAVRDIAINANLHLTVLSADGRVMASSTGDPEALPNQSPLLKEFHKVGELSVGSEPVVATWQDSLSALVAAGNHGESFIFVQGSDRGSQPITRDVLRNSLMGLGMAATVSALFAYLVTRRLTRPLDELRDQAVAMSEGKLDATFGPSRIREFGDLAKAFNRMTARIRDLVSEGQEARFRLETIFENLLEGVMLVDSHETVIAANHRARDLLSLSARSVLGQPLVLVSRDYELVTHFRSVIDKGEPATLAVQFTRSGRTIENTAIPIGYEDQRLGIIVMRDVTELRRLESVRREFVANVSHELRTPLASIRALADTLEAGAIDDPSVSMEFLQKIVGEVDRLTAIVEELLDLARLESGKIQVNLRRVAPGNLVTVAAERLRSQIDRARLDLVIDIADSLPDVMADSSRIEQVIINLLHNGIKFTPAGGELSISASQDDQVVRVDVRDTGMGMPESEISRVFERFYKSDRARRSEGTGLGLAIAKHIVLAHGGYIWAESRLGQGSIFSFTLPIAVEQYSESQVRIDQTAGVA
jgi:two-component system, OmpR family, phosphate regulon sensor histidine kinase PhoR